MEKFKLIFEGLHRAYGTFKEEDEDEKGKKKGKAYIIKAPVTDDLWQNHLSGKSKFWELFLSAMILSVVGVALMLIRIPLTIKRLFKS